MRSLKHSGRYWTNVKVFIILSPLQVKYSNATIKCFATFWFIHMYIIFNHIHANYYAVAVKLLPGNHFICFHRFYFFSPFFNLMCLSANNSRLYTYSFVIFLTGHFIIPEFIIKSLYIFIYKLIDRAFIWPVKNLCSGVLILSGINRTNLQKSFDQGPRFGFRRQGKEKKSEIIQVKGMWMLFLAFWLFKTI